MIHFYTIFRVRSLHYLSLGEEITRTECFAKILKMEESDRIHKVYKMISKRLNKTKRIFLSVLTEFLF